MNHLRVFGIGDLHLSFATPVQPGDWSGIQENKPMGIFGDQWHHHYQRIYEQWQEKVTAEDIVLVPGDISWALDLAEAKNDLDFIGSLPGKIILLRGNHDYWWQSISKVRRILPPNVRAIQNDSITLGEVTICGSRGWASPGSAGFSPADELIYRRELQRLAISLQTAPHGAKELMVMMHYMPTAEDHQPTGFIELMQRYGVCDCVYGHLHSWAHQSRLPECQWGIRFSLVSADFIGFSPRLLWRG